MMVLSVAFHGGGVLSGYQRIPLEKNGSEQRRPLLAGLFTLARRSIRAMTDVASPAKLPLVFGQLRCDDCPSDQLLPLLDSQSHVLLVSPFRNSESIAWGLLPGRELPEQAGRDGIAKLVFQPETDEFPIHVHEYSDRCIAVLAGEGTYYYASGALDSFDGSGVVQVPVHGGDVILFLRNVLHTVSASTKGLTLLSYHAPVIPFDDKRQYTLPKVLWRPNLDSVASTSLSASPQQPADHP